MDSAGEVAREWKPKEAAQPKSCSGETVSDSAEVDPDSSEGVGQGTKRRAIVRNELEIATEYAPMTIEEKETSGRKLLRKCPAPH